MIDWVWITACPCCQVGNLIGLIPGTLLFSVFGTQGTSIVRSILDGDTSSSAFVIAIVVVVVGVGVLVTTLLLVRRSLKRLKQRRSDEEANALTTNSRAADYGSGAFADARGRSDSHGKPMTPMEALPTSTSIGVASSTAHADGVIISDLDMDRHHGSPKAAVV